MHYLSPLFITLLCTAPLCFSMKEEPKSLLEMQLQDMNFANKVRCELGKTPNEKKRNKISVPLFDPLKFKEAVSSALVKEKTLTDSLSKLTLESSKKIITPKPLIVKSTPKKTTSSLKKKKKHKKPSSKTTKNDSSFFKKLSDELPEKETNEIGTLINQYIMKNIHADDKEWLLADLQIAVEEKMNNLPRKTPSLIAQYIFVKNALSELKRREISIIEKGLKPIVTKDTFDKEIEVMDGQIFLKTLNMETLESFHEQYKKKQALIDSLYNFSSSPFHSVEKVLNHLKNIELESLSKESKEFTIAMRILMLQESEKKETCIHVPTFLPFRKDISQSKNKNIIDALLTQEPSKITYANEEITNSLLEIFSKTPKVNHPIPLDALIETIKCSEKQLNGETRSMIKAAQLYRQRGFTHINPATYQVTKLPDPYFIVT